MKNDSTTSPEIYTGVTLAFRLITDAMLTGLKRHERLALMADAAETLYKLGARDTDRNFPRMLKAVRNSVERKHARQRRKGGEE